MILNCIAISRARIEPRLRVQLQAIQHISKYNTGILILFTSIFSYLYNTVQRLLEIKITVSLIQFKERRNRSFYTLPFYTKKKKTLCGARIPAFAFFLNQIILIIFTNLSSIFCVIFFMELMFEENRSNQCQLG